MASARHNALWQRLKKLCSRPDKRPPEIILAEKLITAIDRGGIPLNPAKVNAIARNLGLEVSRQAAVEETIERIRQALLRST